MITVVVRGVDDSEWVLDGRRADVGPVMLTGVTGLVAEVDRSTVLRSTGVGADQVGWSYPAMQGSLSVAVRRWPGMEKGEIYAAFRAAWSTSRLTELVVVDGFSEEWSCRAMLQTALPVTDRSPWARGGGLQFEVPVLAADGVWQGAQREHAGSGVVVSNDGDLPLHPLARWSGSGQSVTIPGGKTITLPATTQPRLLSTDPGTGFVITDETGKRDNSRWASMRGMPVRGTTLPGQATTWSMTPGVTLLTRELIENPWR